LKLSKPVLHLLPDQPANSSAPSTSDMEIAHAIGGFSSMLLIVLCKDTERANEISTVRGQRKYSDQIVSFTLHELLQE
jgi:hypothetical protein